ncbi:MAG: molybdopterin-dependent oxidoreductase [Parcubacteria group bacterium]|nr:molybdopterin-dependent oxidoreductase [Parcubacteria group bacterium]
MKIISRLNIIGLVLSFTILALTGIVKFLGLYNIFNFDYEIISRYTFNLLHDWSGVLLVLFIIIHLILKNQYFISHKVLKSKFLKIRIQIWYLIIALVLIGVVVALYVSRLSLDSNTIKQLAKSEVTEYQGEKLDSIVDMQNTGIKGTQNINAEDYSLNIAGLVESPKVYSYDEVLELQKYSKVVELNCVVGWKAKILWEGVKLIELLEETNIGEEAREVIFYAQDGYSTSLPLDYIRDREILLAYKINGVVLPPDKGFPFQLVAEQKWGYKWIKWITKIELSDDTEYKGTYESSGYSRDGDLDKPKRESN